MANTYCNPFRQIHPDSRRRNRTRGFAGGTVPRQYTLHGRPGTQHRLDTEKVVTESLGYIDIKLELAISLYRKCV